MNLHAGHLLNADLHCHTTASDGRLGPLELYQRARDKGVELLAITDHDSVEAHYFLQQHFKHHPNEGPELITGVELSTTWSNMEVHIVGLNFPLDHPDLAGIIQKQNDARQLRSLLIARKLVKQLRLSVTPEALLSEITQLILQHQKDSNDNFLLDESSIQIGRPHFAKWLIQNGYVEEMQPAFDKYLSHTKIGNLKAFWPPMSQAVAWIRALGGTAVIAHPGKYNMTRTKLRAMVSDFKQAGGHALEVSGCNQPPGQKEMLAELCVDFQLQASRASDFHTPNNPWVELGKPSPLPANVSPVWLSW